MPNIQEYSATAELTPSDKGIQAAEVAGRRLGQFGNEIGASLKQIGSQFEQHESLVEVSHLARNMSDGEANLNDLWSQVTSDPALKERPDLASTFMKEKVEPFITQMQGAATTRAGKEYALQTGDRLRQQFWRETQADQATITGHVVQGNADRVGNNATVSAARDPSPYNYDLQLKAVQQSADTMSSMMPSRPGEAERVQEWRQTYLETHMRDVVEAHYKSIAASIAQDVGQTGDVTKSAVYAAAKKAYAEDLKGQDWVKGPQWVELGKGLDDAVREGQAQFNAADAMQRRKEDETVDTRLLHVETGMFQDNGHGGVTVATNPQALAELKQIAGMPGAGRHPEKFESLYNAMHTATQDQLDGKEIATDHGTYMTLSNRIGSTTDPLTKAEVDQARTAHSLSNDDWHFLREAASDTKAANPRVNHAMEELHRWQGQIKSTIDKSDPLAGNIDQSGAQQYSYFSWDTENKLRQAIASGEDPDKAVQRLTDPRNPNGFYHFIPQYQTTNKQGLAGVLQMIKPNGVQPMAPVPGGVNHAPPPALPGESPDAYLKRVSH